MRASGNSADESASPGTFRLFCLGSFLRGGIATPSEWLFFRELRVGTARQNGGAQRLDAFALNTLPHTAMKRICYEVKTSRGDFLSELKRPLKRRIGMRYSNEFYFVTPAALVSSAEIPADCGLVEAGHATVAEWKQSDQPSRWLLQLRSRNAGILHDHGPGALA